MISFPFYTFSIFSSLSVSTVYRGIILLSAFVFHFEINFLDNFCVSYLYDDRVSFNLVFWYLSFSSYKSKSSWEWSSSEGRIQRLDDWLWFDKMEDF